MEDRAAFVIIISQCSLLDHYKTDSSGYSLKEEKRSSPSMLQHLQMLFFPATLWGEL
jgi:hypothetical protein